MKPAWRSFLTCVALLLALPFILSHAADPETLPEPLPSMSWNEGKIRVLTYNVYGGRNPDGKRDLTRLVKVMQCVNADVIALQEVDRKTKRLQNRDLLQELSEALKMESAFFESMPYDGGSYGNAALSRLKILSHGGFPLPGEKIEPRSALQIQCQFPGANGKTFFFFSTHLDYSPNESNRSLQAKSILEKMSSQPSLLLGDFNTQSGSPSFQVLTQKWKDTWEIALAEGSTQIPSRKSRIDFIFVNSDQWKVISVKEGEGIFPGNQAWKHLIDTASDHPPVLAELQLR